MIEAIKLFLKEKNIIVPEEWVPACIDFIKVEHQDDYIGEIGWVKNKVLEQWLHADITELASHCLPFGLSKQKLTTIAGQFPLQVNSVRDVGLSAYSQLQKLKKSDVQNETISADMPYQAAWEPKPSRMLMLEITDGTSLIQGMEYSFIPCLSLGMKPGTKILVKGNIQSRRGILFLTKENVSVLGGEVETLLVSNAPENMLNKALGLEVVDNPVALPESGLSHNSQVDQVVPSQYYPSQISQHTQNKNNAFVNQNYITPNISTKGSTSAPCLPSKPKVNEITEEFDDLEDFLDEEAELALLEAERKMNSASHCNQVVTSVNQSTSRHNSSNIGFNKQNLQTSNSIQNFRKNSGTTSSNFPKRVESLVSGSSNKPCLADSLEFDDEEDFLLATEMALSHVSQPQSNSVKQSSANKQDKNSSAGLSIKKNLMQSKITCFSTPLKKKVGSSSSTQNFSSSLKPEFIPSGSSQNSLGSSQFLNTNQNTSSFSVQHKESDNKKRRLEISFEDESVDFELSVFSVKEAKMETKELVFKNKIEEMPEPFQYICLIDLDAPQKTYYTVKGFVLTLLSKLEKEEDRWCLKVKINDGTGSCDVNIDNQILCRLIGMTVYELAEKKKEGKANPVIRNAINQMLSNCQKELIMLSCLLRLEVGPHLNLPLVTELIPLTNSDCVQLMARSIP